MLLLSGFPTDQRNGDKEFVIRRAATNRVLNVLRHWVSKHSQVQRGAPGSGVPVAQGGSGGLGVLFGVPQCWHRFGSGLSCLKKTVWIFFLSLSK